MWPKRDWYWVLSNNNRILLSNDLIQYFANLLSDKAFFVRFARPRPPCQLKTKIPEKLFWQVQRKGYWLNSSNPCSDSTNTESCPTWCYREQTLVQSVKSPWKNPRQGPRGTKGATPSLKTPALYLLRQFEKSQKKIKPKTLNLWGNSQ